MKKVFISYSHKDEPWKDRVSSQLKVLQKHGKLDVWDDRHIKSGDQWDPEIEKAILNSDGAILLVSENFLTSDFILTKEVPLLLRRKDAGEMVLFPLIITPCQWGEIDWLKSLQLRPVDAKPLSGFTDHDIGTLLSDFAGEIKNILTQTMQPPHTVTPVSGPITPGPDKITVSKLPITGDRLFGREKELKILNDAWTNNQTDILTLVAWGGVGKTALVNQWLNQMKVANYRGAQKVFGWSFYSQGAEQGKQASADEFFQETLQWFGDANPEAGSAVDKGRRLARLARQQKTLLILDGLEPLQYPPREITGLEGKLKELAGEKPGQKVLCVITTREPLTDLLNRKGYGVTEIPLEHLSEAAGVELLNNLGATTGSQKDFHEVWPNTAVMRWL